MRKLYQRQTQSNRTRLERPFRFGRQRLYFGDCLDWLAERRPSSISAVITDPPYGLIEYAPEQQEKLRNGRGGVWRLPPSFDGTNRQALPRFTVLTGTDLSQLTIFFETLADALFRALKPGAHVFMASTPTMVARVGSAMEVGGFEQRGIIARTVRTFRGGDRPKNAEDEFSEVSTMPRSCWEPWLLFRKPIDQKTVADNLRIHGTGGLRRKTTETPFLDIIESGVTPDSERAIAPHPSVKPQHFLRQLVHASLPLGRGVILDPFAGSGSTLAACQALGAYGIGVERDQGYYTLAKSAIEELSTLDATPVHLIQEFLPGL